MYRCFGIILGFLTTSIGSYICLYQYKKFKEINQMLERINKKVDKHIKFDENIKVITPFNFETGEIDPNFIYEEDSKNIITQTVLKLIEENNHSFKDEDLSKIVNLINQYKESEESEESKESKESEESEESKESEESEESKESKESKESEESEESKESRESEESRECRAKEAAETLLLLPEDSEEFKESRESEESEESYDKISTPPVREK